MKAFMRYAAFAVVMLRKTYFTLPVRYQSQRRLKTFQQLREDNVKTCALCGQLLIIAINHGSVVVYTGSCAPKLRFNKTSQDLESFTKKLINQPFFRTVIATIAARNCHKIDQECSQP